VIKKAVAVDFPAVVGGVPACKDFLVGRCDRGQRCRFRHLTSRDYDIEMNTMQNRPGGGGPPFVPPLFGPGGGPQFAAGNEGNDWRASMERKRRHMESGGGGNMGGGNMGNVMPQQAFLILQVHFLQHPPLCYCQCCGSMTFWSGSGSGSADP
jgi:hypothetical protein